MAKLLRSASLIHDGCRLEQASFGVGILPHLLSWRPDVVWTQEPTLVRLLCLWRRILGLRYRIIFSNAAPVGPQEYQAADFIQHIHPTTLDGARAFGISAERMEYLPNYATVAEPTQPRPVLRQHFGFSDSDWVILCVAAWNRHHKRIDYLIEEVAALNDPSVRLFLCGQAEPDTPGLRQLAQRKLGDKVTWATLPPEAIGDAMAAADVFVLSSLTEGLPGALIEAAIFGLPTIAHQNPPAKYILEDERWLADLSQTGALTGRLLEFKRAAPPTEACALLRERARKKFSAETLTPRFASMLRQLASKADSISREKPESLSPLP